MKAIVSDIHGNLEALQAVLEDIARHGAEEIYCLGDVVGYGPNPCECVELAMQFRLVLLGNHDHAALFEPRDFNPIAEEATIWTKRALDRPHPTQEASDNRWGFLAELPLGHREGNCVFVHGSVRQPLNEYVFPGDVRNLVKMGSLFALVEHLCFQGHTHVPGVFIEPGEFVHPSESGGRFEVTRRKMMCNVGSVGQPRDGDWRACYVLFDGDSITFRRVEYDVDKTVRKIHDTLVLDQFLGDRLRLGR